MESDDDLQQERMEAFVNRRIISVLVLATMVLTSACGASGDNDTKSTEAATTLVTQSTVATTTTSPTTTTTAGADESCADATDANVEALAAILDRIEADPNTALEEVLPPDEIDILLGELGTRLGTECDTDSAGTAISELITFLAEEATGSGANGRAFIGGFLPMFCAIDTVEFTFAARTVCLTL
jgi:hypothetical protein